MASSPTFCSNLHHLSRPTERLTSGNRPSQIPTYLARQCTQLSSLQLFLNPFSPPRYSWACQLPHLLLSVNPQRSHRHFSPMPGGLRDPPRLSPRRRTRTQDTQEDNGGNEWRGLKQKPNGHRPFSGAEPRQLPSQGPREGGGGNIPFRQIQKTLYFTHVLRADRQTFQS